MSEEFQSPGAQHTRRFLVQGRVQRVGFRAATRRRALALGLTGHARNLADGRVEVVVAGSRDSVNEMARWLERGPALARVDGVEDAGECAVTGDGFVTA